MPKPPFVAKEPDLNMLKKMALRAETDFHTCE